MLGFLSRNTAELACEKLLILDTKQIKKVFCGSPEQGAVYDTTDIFSRILADLWEVF